MKADNPIKPIVVTHPPKLPNAGNREREILAKTRKPKPILNVDKKPI